MTDDDRSRREIKILSAIDEAEEAIREYEFARMAAVENPEVSVPATGPDRLPSVAEKKVAVHVTVMRAFRRLRPLIQEHLSHPRQDDYWNDAMIPTDREATDENALWGLRTLDRLQNRVYPVGRTVNDGPGPAETTTEWTTQLLSRRAYKEITHMLAECATHLGYLEPPSAPEPIYKIDEIEPGHGTDDVNADADGETAEVAADG